MTKNATIKSPKLNPYLSSRFVLYLLALKVTMTTVSDIFTIGEEVEVNGFDGDQDLCFYVGSIIRLYRLTADVRFRDLKTRNGESLEGAIRIEVLRPKPPVFVYEYKSGDAVEVWMENRWCKGSCKIYQSENELGEVGVFCRGRDIPVEFDAYVLMFNILQLLLCLITHDRHTIIKMVFVVGEQVEFTGIEPGFTRAIYTGRVIRMGNGVVDVAHDHAIGVDGYPSIESVAIEQVRVFPEQFQTPIYTGDAVDVWLSGAWWIGKCVGEEENAWVVFFDFKPATVSCCKHYKKTSAIIFVVASSTNKEDTKFKRFWIQSNTRKCSSGEDVQVVENGDVEMSKFKDGNHMFYYGSVTTEFATESLLRILQRKDSYGFYNEKIATDFTMEACQRILLRNTLATESMKHAKAIVRKHQDSIIGPNVSHWRYCDSIWPSFSVGSRIEVLGLEPYYGSAFVGGKIRRFRPDGVDVQYDTIRTLKRRKLVSFVPHGRIRPYPLSWVGNYRPGDVLDAWDGYVWWPGLCVRMEQDRYVIRFHNRFASGTEVPVNRPNLRRSQL
ncbi:hypothetical protein LXL04_036204 [Taraxacum kok-saghyz]